MKVTSCFTLLILLIFTLSIFSIQDAYSVTTLTAVQNGNWNDSATWGGFSPSSGDSFIIPSGITVTVSSNFINSANINNSGIIMITSSTDGIDNSSSGFFINEVGGSIVISNTGIGTGIPNSGNIVNHGTITISTSSAGIDNSGTLSNSGTITISGGGTSILLSSGLLSNSGTINVSNTAGTGIESLGIISNTGTITVQNSGTSIEGVYNDNLISNDGTITVSNTSGNGITNDSSGIIENSFGSILSNSGVIANPGEIDNWCGATYSGTVPTIHAVIDMCASCNPPVSGDWLLTSDCQLSSNATILGNVTVDSSSVLVIPNGKTLDIDFTSKRLLIKTGSNVLIKSGGKIN